MGRKSWLKSKFCTHYYGYFGSSANPMFFFRPRRRVVTIRGDVRVAEQDYEGVLCQGCGHKFFETSKSFGLMPHDIVQEPHTTDNWYIGKPL